MASPKPTQINTAIAVISGVSALLTLNWLKNLNLYNHERQITNNRTRYLYHWTTFRLCFQPFN
jgi:hypothetical protein